MDPEMWPQYTRAMAQGGQEWKVAGSSPPVSVLRGKDCGGGTHSRLPLATLHYNFLNATDLRRFPDTFVQFNDGRTLMAGHRIRPPALALHSPECKPVFRPRQNTRRGSPILRVWFGRIENHGFLRAVGERWEHSRGNRRHTNISRKRPGYRGQEARGWERREGPRGDQGEGVTSSTGPGRNRGAPSMAIWRVPPGRTLAVVRQGPDLYSVSPLAYERTWHRRSYGSRLALLGRVRLNSGGKE
ncbi:hypothetical protein O3P69_010472 [Scylla paramamosain]|uniref:Uncharacterized protein n=1 Tax=Scylla paramamosain TaxID=85552 RepID=A0AAW0TTX4_SCYPA